MLNQAKEWSFLRSRKPLSRSEVNYWKSTVMKNAKVGIEIEANLPERNGTCDRQNFTCQCQATFKAPEPMPQTTMCYEQCSRWDGGNCSIAKDEGCVGINCVAFKQPCSNCSKYDRGCDSCPDLYTLHKDPRYIRDAIGRALEPTKFVGAVGKNGIYKVCKDGSLKGDGGVEVATSGRRVQFGAIHTMLTQITDEMQKYNARMDERCSIHVHLLLSYLDPSFSGNDEATKYLKGEITEMERPMPEIILANFHQLIRRYQAALVWLSIAGREMDHLTRWEKFRKSVLPYSAARHRMAAVTKAVGTASKSKRKYALMNYEPTQFNNEGDVSRFHVEARYMDGCFSPAAITAHACLMYGLLIKAVEISLYGVLRSGDKAYMEHQKEMYTHLCNGTESWDGPRLSDTSRIRPYIPDLKKQARQLICLVKTTLSNQAPADEVLRRLNDKPMAYHLIENKSWEEIERSLLPDPVELTATEQEVLRLVDIGAISECDDGSEWVETVSYQIGQERAIDDNQAEMEALKGSIQEYVEYLANRQEIIWSTEVGGFVNSK